MKVRTLIHRDRAAESLPFPVVRFVREHPFFRAAGPFPFLAPDFLDARPFGGDKALLQSLDFVQQQAPSHQPV